MIPIPNALKVEFICGTTLDKDGELIPQTVLRAAINAAEKHFLQEFGGYSKSHISGGWVSTKTLRTVYDDGLVFSVIVGLVSEECLDRTQAYLKGCFNQESVPYTVTPIFSKF